MNSTPGSRIGSFLLRLFVTFLVCLGILALAILSAIPYGGGGEFLRLIPVAGIVGVIWAVAAFFPAKPLNNVTAGNHTYEKDESSKP